MDHKEKLDKLEKLCFGKEADDIVGENGLLKKLNLKCPDCLRDNEDEAILYFDFKDHEFQCNECGGDYAPGTIIESLFDIVEDNIIACRDMVALLKKLEIS